MVCVQGVFHLKCLLIEYSLYQMWFRFNFVYQKSLKRTFKTCFCGKKITFGICVLVLWINKGYFVVKKQVWNVCIKSSWYTKFLLWYTTRDCTEIESTNHYPESVILYLECFIYTVHQEIIIHRLPFRQAWF